MLLILSGCAQPAMQTASSADDTERRMLTKGDTQADEWLQVQREGSQASSTPQRLSVAEHERAHQRWLDSFTYPIPEFFDREAGGGFTTD